MKKFKKIIFGLGITILSISNYSGQASPCSPYNLTGAEMGNTYDVLGNCSWTAATGGIVDPACGTVTANAGEYWFMYSQINDETYLDFDLNPTSGGGSNPIGDPGFQLYTQPSGTCNTASWTYVGCYNDDDGTGTNGEFERITITAGVDYYIRVFDGDGEMDCAGGGRNDEFRIVFNHEQTNDAICEAVALTPNSGCLQWDNGGAGNPSGGNGSCFAEANVVWFSFVATDDSMTVSTDFAGTEITLTDTDIAIFSSSDNTCTGTFTEVGCDTDGGLGCTFCSLEEMTGLTVGDTYFVMVDGFSTSVGTFCISVYETPDPPLLYGSTCELAHQMYSHDVCFSSLDNGNQGNTNDASGYGNSEGIDQPCSTDDDSGQDAYWSKFTAVDNSYTIDPVDLSPSGVANVWDISVYTGTCGSLTQVDCQSVASDANTFSITTTPGTEYYILMTNGTAYSGAVRRLSICGSSACTAPSNDACGSATSVTDGVTYTITNACATADLGLCSGSTENNVWVVWTADAGWIPGDAAFVTLANSDCYDNEDPAGGSQLSVFNSTETCATISGGSTAECVVYNNPNNQNNFNANFIANPGETYYMTIDGFGGDGCTFSYRVNNTAPVVPLAAELEHFEGKWNKQSGNNIIDWTTLSELNTDRFEIERSKEGFYFEKIGEVKAAGNSTAVLDYNFIDEDPHVVTYYRLKQYENNGSYVLSDIITVRHTLTRDNLSIFPNPSEDGQVSIEFPGMGQDYEIALLDITGKKVYQSSGSAAFSHTVIKEDFSKLPKGIYFVNYSDNQTSFSTKLILK